MRAKSRLPVKINGIYMFEDGLQCEEWAMLRGACPMGGVRVTGYSSEAACYCAVTGGEYTPTGNEGRGDEQGAFTINGVQCDVWAHYNG